MKKISFSISPTQVVHAITSVAVVFALTVVMLLIGRSTLGEGVIALLYLAPIGWCTIRWGQIAGTSAALTAALCFDFLFIPPYGTFNIGSLEGWLLLVLFIAAAILVIGRIQSILTDEHNRVQQATFLYEILVAIANQQTREGIATSIANEIQQKYLAKLVQVHLDGREIFQPFTARSDNGLVTSPVSRPDRALPIISGPELIGEIAIWKGIIPLPSEDDLMLQTMLRQISAALERAQTEERSHLP